MILKKKTTETLKIISISMLASGMLLVGACSKTAEQPEALKKEQVNDAAVHDDGHAGMADAAEVEAVKQIEVASENMDVVHDDGHAGMADASEVEAIQQMDAADEKMEKVVLNAEDMEAIKEMEAVAENMETVEDDGHAGMADAAEIEAVKAIDSAVETAKN